MLSVLCSCGKTLKAPLSYADKTVTCPNCKQAVSFPSLFEAGEPASPVSPNAPAELGPEINATPAAAVHRGPSHRRQRAAGASRERASNSGTAEPSAGASRGVPAMAWIGGGLALGIIVVGLTAIFVLGRGAKAEVSPSASVADVAATPEAVPSGSVSGTSVTGQVASSAVAKAGSQASSQPSSSQPPSSQPQTTVVAAETAPTQLQRTDAVIEPLRYPWTPLPDVIADGTSLERTPVQEIRDPNDPKRVRKIYGNGDRGIMVRLDRPLTKEEAVTVVLITPNGELKPLFAVGERFQPGSLVAIAEASEPIKGLVFQVPAFSFATELTLRLPEGNATVHGLARRPSMSPASPNSPMMPANNGSYQSYPQQVTKKTEVMHEPMATTSVALDGTADHVAYAAGAGILAVQLNDHRITRLVDVASGRMAGSIVSPSTQALMAAGGKSVVVYEPESDRLLVFDAASGKELKTFPSPFSSKLNNIAMSALRDDRLVVITQLERRPTCAFFINLADGSLDGNAGRVPGLSGSQMLFCDPWFTALRCGGSTWSLMGDGRWRQVTIGGNYGSAGFFWSDGGSGIFNARGSAGSTDAAGLLTPFTNQPVIPAPTNWHTDKSTSKAFIATLTPNILIRIADDGLVALVTATADAPLLELGGLPGMTSRTELPYLQPQHQFDRNSKPMAALVGMERFYGDLDRKRFAFVSLDNERVEIAQADLAVAVEKSAQPLLIPSHPLVHYAQPGTTLTTMLSAFSSGSGKITYKLESDNSAADVSDEGKLSYRMPIPGQAAALRLRVDQQGVPPCYTQVLVLPSVPQIPAQQTRNPQALVGLDGLLDGDVYVPGPGIINGIVPCGDRWAVAAISAPVGLAVFDLQEARMVQWLPLATRPTALMGSAGHCLYQGKGATDYTIASLPDLKTVGTFTGGPGSEIVDKIVSAPQGQVIATVIRAKPGDRNAELRILRVPEMSLEKSFPLGEIPTGEKLAISHRGTRVVLTFQDMTYHKKVNLYSKQNGTWTEKAPLSPSMSQDLTQVDDLGQTCSENHVIMFDASGVQLPSVLRDVVVTLTGAGSLVLVETKGVPGNGTVGPPSFAVVNRVDGSVVRDLGMRPGMPRQLSGDDTDDGPISREMPRPMAYYQVETGRGFIIPSTIGLVIRQPTPGAGMALIASVAPAEYLPGERWHYEPELLPKPQGRVVWSLNNAPIGMAINATTGAIDWLPRADSEGSKQVELVASIDGKPVTQAISMTIPPRSLADPKTWSLPGTDLIFPDDQVWMPNLDQEDPILCRDAIIYPIATNGSPQCAIDVGERVLSLTARGDDVLALLSNQVITYNRSSGKETRRQALDLVGAYRIIAVPERRQCFLIYREPRAPQGLDKRVAVFDERTGKATPLDRVFGGFAACSPDGKVLYTAVSELFQVNLGQVVDAWGQSFSVKQRNDVALLLRYELSGGRVRLTHVQDSPGLNTRRVVVSPDGDSVGYVSGGGYPGPGGGYSAVSFDGKDLATVKGIYPTNAYPKGMIYHPSLPMVAAWNDETLRIYPMNGGTAINPDVFAPEKGIMVAQVVFSEDGRYLFASLIITLKSGGILRKLVRIDVPISEKDQRELARKLPPRKPVLDAEAPPHADPLNERGPLEPAPQGLVVTSGVKRPFIGDFTALRKAGTVDMNPKRVAEAYGSSVVLISHERGTGTGYFMSANGYVLTCAHVISGGRAIKVHYQSDKGEAVETTAVIIATDVARDIALLKIEVTGAKYVRFAATDVVAMGERVVAIGNPGMGEAVLNNTMTEGIVSNADRQVEGTRWLQTSAAVNPGNSGGPLFDEKGNVIGMVVARADIEGTGFAIHRSALVAFLNELTKP